MTNKQKKEIFKFQQQADPIVVFMGKKALFRMRMAMKKYRSQPYQRVLSKIWDKRQKHINQLKKVRKSRA
jgi:hypothetical protein